MSEIETTLLVDTAGLSSMVLLDELLTIALLDLVLLLVMSLDLMLLLDMLLELALLLPMLLIIATLLEARSAVMLEGP